MCVPQKKERHRDLEHEYKWVHFLSELALLKKYNTLPVKCAVPELSYIQMNMHCSLFTMWCMYFASRQSEYVAFTVCPFTHRCLDVSDSKWQTQSCHYHLIRLCLTDWIHYVWENSLKLIVEHLLKPIISELHIQILTLMGMSTVNKKFKK